MQRVDACLLKPEIETMQTRDWRRCPNKSKRINTFVPRAEGVARSCSRVDYPTYWEARQLDEQDRDEQKTGQGACDFTKGTCNQSQNSNTKIKRAKATRRRSVLESRRPSRLIEFDASRPREPAATCMSQSTPDKGRSSKKLRSIKQRT